MLGDGGVTDAGTAVGVTVERAGSLTLDGWAALPPLVRATAPPTPAAPLMSRANASADGRKMRRTSRL
jgi:hypothetical protein